jgi:hypothetical protein
MFGILMLVAPLSLPPTKVAMPPVPQHIIDAWADHGSLDKCSSALLIWLASKLNITIAADYNSKTRTWKKPPKEELVPAIVRALNALALTSPSQVALFCVCLTIDRRCGQLARMRPVLLAPSGVSCFFQTHCNQGSQRLRRRAADPAAHRRGRRTAAEPASQGWL